MKHKAIPSPWLQRLPKDEHDDFETTLRNSKQVLQRLRGIIKERLAVLDNKDHAISEYDSPSWAYKQAHINGRKAELTELLKLTDFIGDT